jgi:hypothetical protein
MLYQVSVHSIRLPKNSTVGDVLNDIKSKVNICMPYFMVCCHILVCFVSFIMLTHVFCMPSVIVNPGRAFSSRCWTPITWSFLPQDIQGGASASWTPLGHIYFHTIVFFYLVFAADFRTQWEDREHQRSVLDTACRRGILYCYVTLYGKTILHCLRRSRSPPGFNGWYCLLFLGSWGGEKPWPFWPLDSRVPFYQRHSKPNGNEVHLMLDLSYLIYWLISVL